MRLTLTKQLPAWTAAAAFLFLGLAGRPQAAEKYEPKPRVVTPGEGAKPPSDAIVLFDGKDLSMWQSDKGAEPTWTVEGGVMTVKPKTGSIMTKQKFGDVQVHVEFATPLMPEAKGQDRGNSGVYLQGRYEVQVLDSYKSDTYIDGQCGAIYSAHPPLVNACRPPEQWQTYDIVFHRPKFESSGKMTAPGRFTVLHNGVLIQDNAEIGESTHASLYKDAAAEGPLLLQDHWNPVKYRNIWVRPLDTK